MADECVAVDQTAIPPQQTTGVTAWQTAIPSQRSTEESVSAETNQLQIVSPAPCKPQADKTAMPNPRVPWGSLHLKLWNHNFPDPGEI